MSYPTCHTEANGTARLPNKTDTPITTGRTMESKLALRRLRGPPSSGQAKSARYCQAAPSWLAMQHISIGLLLGNWTSSTSLGNYAQTADWGSVRYSTVTFTESPPFHLSFILPHLLFLLQSVHLHLHRRVASLTAPHVSQLLSSLSEADVQSKCQCLTGTENERPLAVSY